MSKPQKLLGLHPSSKKSSIGHQKEKNQNVRKQKISQNEAYLPIGVMLQIFPDPISTPNIALKSPKSLKLIPKTKEKNKNAKII